MDSLKTKFRSRQNLSTTSPRKKAIIVNCVHVSYFSWYIINHSESWVSFFFFLGLCCASLPIAMRVWKMKMVGNVDFVIVKFNSQWHYIKLFI